MLNLQQHAQSFWLFLVLRSSFFLKVFQNQFFKRPRGVCVRKKILKSFVCFAGSFIGLHDCSQGHHYHIIWILHLHEFISIRIKRKQKNLCFAKSAPAWRHKGITKIAELLADFFLHWPRILEIYELCDAFHELSKDFMHCENKKKRNDINDSPFAFKGMGFSKLECFLWKLNDIEKIIYRELVIE